MRLEARGSLAVVAFFAFMIVFVGALATVMVYALETSSAPASPSLSRDSATDDYRRCMAECLGREESAQ